MKIFHKSVSSILLIILLLLGLLLGLTVFYLSYAQTDLETTFDFSVPSVQAKLFSDVTGLQLITPEKSCKELDRDFLGIAQGKILCSGKFEDFDQDLLKDICRAEKLEFVSFEKGILTCKVN